MEEIEEIQKSLKPILEGKITGDDEIYDAISTTNERLTRLKRRLSTAIDCLQPRKQHAPQTFPDVMLEWAVKYAAQINAMLATFKAKKHEDVPKKDGIFAAQLVVAFIFHALKEGYNVFYTEDEKSFVVIYREDTNVICSGTSAPRWPQQLFRADEVATCGLIQLEQRYENMFKQQAFS